MLRDKDFVATHLGDDVPERKVLYEDPAARLLHLGARQPRREGQQAARPWPDLGDLRPGQGETLMTDWECLERPHDGKPGKARHVRDYALKPGMAHLYDEGVLHSPSRDGATRLIRLEGMNMDRVSRLPVRGGGVGEQRSTGPAHSQLAIWPRGEAVANPLYPAQEAPMTVITTRLTVGPDRQHLEPPTGCRKANTRPSSPCRSRPSRAGVSSTSPFMTAPGTTASPSAARNMTGDDGR